MTDQERRDRTIACIVGDVASKGDLDRLAAAVNALSYADVVSALAGAAAIHVARTQGGARFVPDVPHVDAVLAAAERSHAAARGVAAALDEVTARHVLAELAWQWVAQLEQAARIELQAGLN